MLLTSVGPGAGTGAWGAEEKSAVAPPARRAAMALALAIASAASIVACVKVQTCAGLGLALVGVVGLLVG
jgi:hypothetical protein